MMERIKRMRVRAGRVDDKEEEMSRCRSSRVEREGGADGTSCFQSEDHKVYRGNVEEVRDDGEGRRVEEVRDGGKGRRGEEVRDGGEGRRDGGEERRDGGDERRDCGEGRRWGIRRRKRRGEKSPAVADLPVSDAIKYQIMASISW